MVSILIPYAMMYSGDQHDTESKAFSNSAKLFFPTSNKDKVSKNIPGRIMKKKIP